jgi:hypothetical protein
MILVTAYRIGINRAVDSCNFNQICDKKIDLGFLPAHCPRPEDWWQVHNPGHAGNSANHT